MDTSNSTVFERPWVATFLLLLAPAALAQSSEEYEEYAESLPRQKDYYIYEDQAVSKEQLDYDFELQQQGRLKPVGRGTLVVNVTEDGQLDYWKSLESRRLTYSIDVRSFHSAEEAEFVRAVMEQAAEDWREICVECGIEFVHEAAYDEYPSPFDTSFVVRRNDEDFYIISSFFPSWPQERKYFNVGSPFFDAAIRDYVVGIVRHELGHVLGYRHNQSGIAGCPEEEGGTPYKRFDPRSIMRFPCGESTDLEFEFTADDIRSHRALYGPGTLLVEIEEPELSNIIKALEIASEVEGLLQPVASTDDAARICGDFLMAFDVAIRPSRSECRRIRSFAASIATSVTDRYAIPDLSIRVVPQSRTFLPGKVGERDLARLQKRIPGVVVETEKHGYMTAYWDSVEIAIPLSFESIDRASDAAISMNKSRTLMRANIQSMPDPDWPTQKVMYDAVQPSDYMSQCQAAPNPPGGAALPDFGSYHMLAGAKPDELPPCATQSCSGTGCPQLILIDSRVLLHPDLRGGVTQGATPRPADYPETEEVAASCSQISVYEQNVHHGTHLAGIMVSQDKFYGVGRPAKLVSHDRNVSNAGLRYVIRQEANQPRNIFVFASSIDYEQTDQYLLSGVPNDPDQNTRAWRERAQLERSRQESLTAPAKEIFDAPHIPWVIAIGQPSDGQSQIVVDDNSAFSPANLADRPNVIVVTACEKCASPTSPEVWSDAHYGTGDLVAHIAAPGGVDSGGIPATASWTRYYRAYGTSQAAAFIGGVAGSMTACYPDEYVRNARRLKEWLQVTAKPIFEDSAGAARVSSGSVDVKRALRDPTKSYSELALHGERTHEPSAIRWCSDDYRFQLGTAVRTRIETNQIYRIRKVDLGGSDAWIVYTNSDEEPGKVERHGPFNSIDFPRDREGPILKIGDSTVALSDIEEVLLSRPLHLDGPVACSTP